MCITKSKQGCNPSRNINGWSCEIPRSLQGSGYSSGSRNNKLKSQDGWIVLQNIDGLTLVGGTFDGQGSTAWAENNCARTGKCNSLPINLRFNMVNNSIIRDITSLNGKLFHMNLLGCNNITLQHVTIDAPATSLNTDGIHVGGDGSQHVNVEKVNCGPGHGISIGSLGKYHNEEPVIGVTIRNCTLTNTMNGVRVKTWPASPNGLARDLHFENLVMNNVSTPILIDQQYCPYGQCKAQVPSKVKITDVSFKDIRGTSATKLAVKLVCSRGTPCQNVEMSGIHLVYQGNNGSATSQCANVKPMLTGPLFPPACASSLSS
ncbi:hypothetical protein RJ639_036211 [Escallonia herrerae]|uniref:Uncharacterized protein n=1 Tax=Escallonia herrerae TaxID=1293975 RepID=A0AA88WQ75_9ASTE|nr:hypothetical protein RJ639_036211 [Escallonia herrerae]